MTDKITPELEAVAKALHDVDHTMPWDRVVELSTKEGYIVAKNRVDRYRKLARAALTAIREPSDNLLSVGTCLPISAIDERTPLRVVWRMMIDHVLGDER